jgi:excisionase family DNA binding protein
VSELLVSDDMVSSVTVPSAVSLAASSSCHRGIAKDTIYRWIKTRGLPAHRVGTLCKSNVSEVDASVERGGAGDGRSTNPLKRGRP